MTTPPLQDLPLLESIAAPAGSPVPIHVDVLRLDRLHPVISGNKWFKLKGHWAQILRSSGTIITFGGAWSNHLIATACAAKQAGLTAIGIVRGEEPAALSATLSSALDYGMRLEYVSRSRYAEKNSPDFLQSLIERYPGAYIIPEGGGGMPGIAGCEEILPMIDSHFYTHILCAVGTGTMLLGLARSSLPGQTVIGVPVLRGFDPLSAPDAKILSSGERSRIRLLSGYHFGGYARHPAALLDFMKAFHRLTAVPSDIVYTGKLFYAAMDSISANLFPAGARLLLIHSGGLQGNRSLPPGSMPF